MKISILVSVLVLHSSLASAAVNLSDFFQSDLIKKVCAKGTYSTGRNSWVDYPSLFTQSESGLFWVQKERMSTGFEFQVYTASTPSSEPQLLFTSQEKIIDLEYADNSLWVATEKSLTGVDLLTRKTVGPLRPQTKISAPGYDEKIHQILSFQGEIFVAHGTLGLYSFNPSTKSFSFHAEAVALQKNGHVSKIGSIASLEDHLILAYSPVTLDVNGSRAFTGFVVIDPRHRQSTNTAALVYKNSGILGRTKTTIAGNRLIVNNSGVFQYFDINQILKSKAVGHQWTFVNQEKDGKLHYGQLFGDLLNDGKNLYSCAQFSYQDPKTMKVTSEVVPFIFDLQDL